MEKNELITILEAIAKLSNQIAQLSLEKTPNLTPETRSKEINELASALAKAQAEFKIAGLTKENPYYKSWYSDLADITKASRPALTNNGLSVIQQIIQDNEGANILNTILLHSSGQWIESRMRIIPPKADVQSLGSYITYLRRYAYASITGVVSADEDDDGENAVHDSRENSNKGTQLNNKYNPKQESLDTITKEQLEELKYELHDHMDIAEDILEKMKLTTLADMPRSKFLSSIKRVREIVQIRDGK